MQQFPAAVRHREECAQLIGVDELLAGSEIHTRSIATGEVGHDATTGKETIIQFVITTPYLFELSSYLSALTMISVLLTLL